MTRHANALARAQEQTLDGPLDPPHPFNAPSTAYEDPADPLVGRTFGGKYCLTQKIGAGGMGAVYLARQQGLNRDVVVKLLRQETQRDGSMVKRFEREAQALSLLNHTNIVNVYDFGQEGPLSYLVMEHIPGASLDAFMRQAGPLPHDTFFTIACQILRALAEAHDIGLVHRDIKPSNIMLTSRKDNPYHVKVLDFGLVKLLAEESDLTGHNKLMGTIAYLAPEQILSQEITPSADVYALGVLFYHMLAGQKPFTGLDMAVLHQHINQPPEPLLARLDPAQRVPKATAALIHRCLAKLPHERPQDAHEVLLALTRQEPEPASFDATPFVSSTAPTILPTLEVEPLSDDATLDHTFVLGFKRREPERLDQLMDRFIGELPELLSSLDLHPELRMTTLAQIEQLAQSLGARNLARQATMFTLLIQQGLLDPHARIGPDLEGEYASAFRALYDLLATL